MALGGATMNRTILLALRTIIFALFLAFLVGAFRDSTGVYPVPLDRARQILSKTDLPPIFGSNTPGIEILNRPSEVSWIVRDNGSEFMRFVAKLSDAGEGRTRVGLELKGVKSGPAGNVEQRFAENPSLKNVYVEAMAERIASAMEGRPLDMTKVYPALMVAAIVLANNTRRFVDEAAKSAEELDRTRKRR